MNDLEIKRYVEEITNVIEIESDGTCLYWLLEEIAEACKRRARRINTGDGDCAEVQYWTKMGRDLNDLVDQSLI